jgi:hypothetical protein
MKKIFLIILSMAMFTACERKIDEFSSNANGVDFSKYVSVGNSLTAGYADGALYQSGQTNSYPNIMAGQFKYVGGGNFSQPYLVSANDVGVGFTLTPAGPYFTTKYALKRLPNYLCDGSPDPTTPYSIKPTLYDPAASQAMLGLALTTRPTDPGPYNNMGVPGARAKDLLTPGYGSSLGNPYFARFATNPLTTIIQDAAVQQPTFFSLWIGNNDVLASALAGTDQLITPVDTFAKYYNLALGAMLNSGKSPKGILATIPDVSTAPYFNTISKQLPYNFVVLDSAQAAGLNMLYTIYGHPDIVWKKGQNPCVVALSATVWVQMGPEDLFLLNLPTDSVKCHGMGIADQYALPLPKPYPIPGKYVLDKNEQANIQNAVTEYNAIITKAATDNKLALADMNSYMKTLESGIVFDGITMSTTFVTGGLFSTDGLHLNPRGSAVAANYFIQTINGYYGCSIPQVDITNYPACIFP